MNMNTLQTRPVFYIFGSYATLSKRSLLYQPLMNGKHEKDKLCNCAV